jgi:hypothetical protein
VIATVSPNAPTLELISSAMINRIFGFGLAATLLATKTNDSKSKATTDFTSLCLSIVSLTFQKIKTNIFNNI